jgi:hypothetical protein
VDGGDNALLDDFKSRPELYKHSYTNHHYNVRVFFSDDQLQHHIQKQHDYRDVASELVHRPAALTASISTAKIDFVQALLSPDWDEKKPYLPTPVFLIGMGLTDPSKHHFLFVSNDDIYKKVSLGQLYTCDNNEFITGDECKQIFGRMTDDLYKRQTIVNYESPKRVKMVMGYGR